MADLIGIWTFQWIRPRDLRSRQDSDSTGIMMTQKRFESMVNSAYKAGFSSGEHQGRVNMRKDIESGEIPPITPLS